MKYQVNRAVARWQIVDAEAVVVHAETSYYYGLNRTGTVVWTALAEGPLTEGDLTTRLVDACDVDPAVALADVRALLADLVRESLVTED